MTFLTDYYDPSIKLNDELTPGKVTAEEQRRLSRNYIMALTAETIPRRLGPDASPDEMAADKKRCRRVAHAIGQPLNGWGGRVEVNGLGPDAAQLDWKKWWANEKTYINARMRYIATMGITQPQHMTWAKQAVVRLRNELQWCEYALR